MVIKQHILFNRKHICSNSFNVSSLPKSFGIIINLVDLFANDSFDEDELPSPDKIPRSSNKPAKHKGKHFSISSLIIHWF